MSSIKDYLILTRIHKPIGIYLLLWPTLWALWIATHGAPAPSLLVVFVLGVIIMRSAGCVMNDIADRHFDAHVTRTQQRPLATGRINTTQALITVGALLLLALSLVLTLNWFAIALALPAVLLAGSYPFMKRYTHLPQVVLGVAFSWSILMVFAATHNHLPTIVWPLF